MTISEAASLRGIYRDDFTTVHFLAYLADHCDYPFPNEIFRRLHPLAHKHLKHVVKRIERILSLHSQVIPVPVKILALRCLRRLSTFPESYAGVLLLGELTRQLADDEERMPISFRAVFETLASLDGEEGSGVNITPRKSMKRIDTMRCPTGGSFSVIGKDK